MEKVKLTKTQADALESYLAQHSRVILIREFFKNTLFHGFNEIFKNVTTDELIRALYVGYEVDLTPEERIKAMYDRNVHEYDDQLSADIIRDVLNILNIRIEGVNA